MKHLRHAFVALVFTLLASKTFAVFDPQVGRWTSRDPIGEKGGLNLYVYVENNPINFIDPLGLEVGLHYGMDGSITPPAMDNNRAVISGGVMTGASVIGGGFLAWEYAIGPTIRNTKLDGPKMNKDGVSGRICQLRWQNTPLLRLDFHNLPGPEKSPVLHLNVGPWEGKNSIHIPIQWNPSPWMTPPY